MAIDDLLDSGMQYLKNLVDWTVYKLPVLLLPHALYLTNVALEICNVVKNQTCITARAIVRSFKNETLYFFDYNGLYIPVLSTNKHILKGEYRWFYSAKDSTFYTIESAENDSIYQLDMLGASVCRSINSTEAVSVGDLSEWIQDQKVFSTSGTVPYQILVSAWAYSTNRTVQYNYENYVFICMDLEGNEKAYNLQTGDELETIPTLCNDDSNDSDEEEEDEEEEDEEEEEEEEEDTGSSTNVAEETTEEETDEVVQEETKEYDETVKKED